MPKRCFALMLAALMLTAAPVFSASAQQALGVRHELPNGLVWLFSEQTNLPLVTINLVIKGGILRDPVGKEGLANLTALLMLQGTKSKNATQIAQEIDFLGAKLTSSGGDDYSSISLTVLKKDLPEGLALVRDILKNPIFPPDELRQKVSQLKAALKSEEDEPGTVAARAFDKRLFGENPYAHPIKGTPEGLFAITRKDVVEFHQKFYRPNNAILAVVGDLTPDEAAKFVAQTFEDWEKASVPPLQLPPPPALNKPEVVVINKDITQANIIWGHLGIDRQNPDYYALQIMDYILGSSGFASRLMNNIREKRGLAYSVSSSFDAGLQPGSVSVSLETKNASASTAVEEVLREIKRLRAEPVTSEELEDAKSYLIGSFPRKIDSLSKRAWILAYVELYGLGLDYPFRYPGLIRGLTPADIQRVAEKYLHPDRYLLVVVGNKAEMPKFDSGTAPPGSMEKKHVPKPTQEPG